MMSDDNKLIFVEPDDGEILALSVLIEKVTTETRSRAKTDIELLKILEKHILKENVEHNAVKNAAIEIQELAEKRVETGQGK